VRSAPVADFGRNQADFSIASVARDITFPCSVGKLNREENVNSELCKQALAKVGNPNVLINLVSRRVRQLNSGGGSLSRPLLNDTTGLGAADIALTEIIEDKMGWEAPEELLAEVSPKRRNKRG
jgi:DNA-directed RNA polymerase subunit omega